MLIRILLIWLGTYAVINLDFESNNIFYSKILTIFNLFYLIFLIKEFVRFLYSLRDHGTKGNEANIGTVIQDFFSLLHSDIASKYTKKALSEDYILSPFVEAIVTIEVLCVLISLYYQFQFIAYFIY